MLITYFEIGRMIVEDEQKGEQRAGYAEKILHQLSMDLTKEFGKGYSVDNLERFRKFYTTYQNRIPASAMWKSQEKQKSATSLRKSEIIQSAIGKNSFSFSLSWTHYIQLLKIESEEDRSFYEIEATQNNWSVRELMRQYNAALYERMMFRQGQKGVKELAAKGQLVEKPTDVLKSHCVLEFLNLKDDNRYSESELETAIINKLEHFMLELGKGFLFEGRQRRFTFEGDSFFVDLVFYNRLLKCFVLFELLCCARHSNSKHRHICGEK